MRLILPLLLALPLLGCAHVKPTAVQATGEAIAVTDAHLSSQAPHIDYLVKHSDGESKVHAESAEAERVAAKKSNAEAESSFNKVAKQLASVLASWSYKIGHFIVTNIVIAIVLAIGCAVIRVWALSIPGPFGAILSKFATAIFGLLTGGLGFLFVAAESAYHRRQVAASPTPPAAE